MICLEVCYRLRGLVSSILFPQSFSLRRLALQMKQKRKESSGQTVQSAKTDLLAVKSNVNNMEMFEKNIETVPVYLKVWLSAPPRPNPETPKELGSKV